MKSFPVPECQIVVLELVSRVRRGLPQPFNQALRIELGASRMGRLGHDPHKAVLGEQAGCPSRVGVRVNAGNRKGSLALGAATLVWSFSAMGSAGCVYFESGMIL